MQSKVGHVREILWRMSEDEFVLHSIRVKSTAGSVDPLKSCWQQLPFQNIHNAQRLLQRARLSVLLLGSDRHWHADVDSESSYLVNDALVPAGNINICKGHFHKDAAMSRVSVWFIFFRSFSGGQKTFPII